MKLNKFKSSEITPENFYINRRKFLKKMGIVTGTAFASQNIITSALSYTPETERKITPYKFATTYNNYYEFGTSKSDPHKNSKDFITKPWDIKIDGEVENEITLSVEEIKNMIPSEERIYRFRCVEAWSMTVPWAGFPLNKILSLVEPKKDAKFLKFETFYDPEIAPGQKQKWYPWPYQEGITIEEAKNELSFLATGIYGKKLPNQNGAPLRLVLPWKYGFKSIKSIVKISFLAERPIGLWEKLAPNEYGFWANVNPKVSHPRWSQETEQQLGIDGRIPTVKYNGYEEQVSYLYKGLEKTLQDKLFR